MRKMMWIIPACVLMIISVIIVGVLVQNTAQQVTAEKLADKYTKALGSEYQKQTSSEVVAKLTYASKDASHPIYYYIIKTTYFHTAPEDIKGLNTHAFFTVLNPYSAETAEEMMVRDWNGCLYTFPEKSYLCWTVTPECSCILAYDPAAVSQADIIRMAESIGSIK